MKLNDERRKVLSEYLGLCWHEGRMPINCGYRCVKCGDTYVANRTFDTDADMMALFRKMVDLKEFDKYRYNNPLCNLTLSVMNGSLTGEQQLLEKKELTSLKEKRNKHGY